VGDTGGAEGVGNLGGAEDVGGAGGAGDRRRCHGSQGPWLEVSVISGLTICCGESDKTSNTK
jgi:hypothetical protein